MNHKTDFVISNIYVTQKSEPGSSLSSADTLCLMKKSSERAQEAAAAATALAPANMAKINTKHFIFTTVARLFNGYNKIYL